MSTIAKSLSVLTLAPPFSSGPGNATIRLAKELNYQGHHIHIAAAASAPDFSKWRELADALAGEEIHLQAVGSASHFDDTNPALADELAEQLRTPGFDIIHAHSGTAAQVAQEARSIAKSQTPILATVHDWNSLQPSWMNDGDIRALNRCDLVIATSRQQARLLKAWGVNRSIDRTIYWGTDLAPRRVRITNRPLPGVFRIVNICPVAPPADLRTMIRAFAELHLLVERSELIIAGPVLDDRYLAAMHLLAEKLGIRHSVHFVGQIDDPLLWLREAHMFVSTAINNQLCLMLIDALGYGLPCACSRIEGHQDIAEEGKAMLAFEPENHGELAKRMIWIHGHPTSAAHLGENARLTASLKYSWRRVAESYASAYLEVCHQANAVAA
jgi:glycosyltransferase involved in cell wall biosynthesis